MKRAKIKKIDENIRKLKILLIIIFITGILLFYLALTALIDSRVSLIFFGISAISFCKAIIYYLTLEDK